MSLTLLFDWQDHAETIVVGGVLLLAFGVYAYVKGWPQRTISSLMEVTTADEKALARGKRENASLTEERDGYKSDVARLMREAKVYVDGAEQDEAAINSLRAECATQAQTIIDLRKELTEAYEKLSKPHAH